MHADAPALVSALIALALCAGCEQLHLEIGDGDDDASVPLEGDASVVRDASAEAASPSVRDGQVDASKDAGTEQKDGGGPLRAQLSALGIRGLSSITGSCIKECLTIETEVQGGSPPYQVSWADGPRGARREVCADTSIPSSRVSVTDSRGARFELDVGVATVPCLDEAFELPQWSLCYEAPLVASECPPGVLSFWFDLGRTLDSENSQISFAFTGITLFSILNASASGATELCGENLGELGRATVMANNGALYANTVKGMTAPIRYAFVEAIDNVWPPFSPTPISAWVCLFR